LPCNALGLWVICRTRRATATPKDGGSLCSDDKHDDFKASLNTPTAPAIFTPGDNDCTDLRSRFGRRLRRQ
jgi:hypothetical protein